MTHPRQLDALIAGAQPGLPGGPTLTAILAPDWPSKASTTIQACEESVAGWQHRLGQFPPEVLDLDLSQMAADFQAASTSRFIGRKKRMSGVLEPLNALLFFRRLIHRYRQRRPCTGRFGRVARHCPCTLDHPARHSGPGEHTPGQPLQPGGVKTIPHPCRRIAGCQRALRGDGPWMQTVLDLASALELKPYLAQLTALANAWRQLWVSLAIQDEDLSAWRAGRSLLEATNAYSAEWTRQRQYERLMPLQHWCVLSRQLEPLRQAQLNRCPRVELLEGRLPADQAADALDRGIAKASMAERIAAGGLDRFNSVAHDQRVQSYSQAQSDLRERSG